MILVDPIVEYSAEMTRGLPSARWCHMVSDHSPEELHAFAVRLGLKRAWFQSKGPAHYDLTPTKRELAVRLGAREVTSRELAISNYDGTFRRSGRAEPSRVSTANGSSKQVSYETVLASRYVVYL